MSLWLSFYYTRWKCSSRFPRKWDRFKTCQVSSAWKEAAALTLFSRPINLSVISNLRDCFSSYETSLFELLLTWWKTDPKKRCWNKSAHVSNRQVSRNEKLTLNVLFVGTLRNLKISYLTSIKGFPPKKVL